MLILVKGGGGYYPGWPCGPYPAPVVLLPRGSKELGVGDRNATEGQVHLQHLWTFQTHHWRKTE